MQTDLIESPSPEKHSWKRNCAALLLAFSPVVLAAAGSAGDDPAEPLTVSTQRPTLVFSEYLMHFGNEPVPAQAEVNVTFLFRNLGEQSIQITDTQASCGCVAPRLSTQTVAPGESGRLTVPVKTATQNPGPHVYTVTVHYTDPEPREVLLTVKMTLPEKTVQVEPKAIYVIGQSSQSVEHTVTISDLRETPLHVKDVSSSTPLFTPRIVERQRDHEGSRTTIGVAIAETLPRGVQRGIIQVSTSDPVTPLLQIPVMARGPERDAGELVAYQPEHFRLAATADHAVPATVELTLPASWKISHIDAFPLELSASFENLPISRDDLQQLRISLQFSQLPEGRVLEGVVTIHANEGADMVTIPVQIVWPVE